MISELWTWIQLPFMQNGLLIATLISVPTAMLSCFLVVKGWALMGDAVSHAVLPGIVIAYMLGIPLVLGAFVTGLVCTLASGFVENNSRVKSDTALGVIFAGLFGLGLVLFTQVKSNIHLDHILFGSLLGISRADMWAAISVCIAVSLWVLLYRRDLLLHAFDPVQAHALGLRTRWLHYGLLVALSLTVVSSLKLAGIILAIGLLIAPGVIAYLLTPRFGYMLVIAVAVSLTSNIAGIILSMVWGSAPGPTIIVLLSICFLLTFLFQSQRQTRAVETIT